MRRQRILARVREMSFVGATELSEFLGVSEMTIRRDIRLLDERGLARSVHGGVTRIAETKFGTDFHLRSTMNHEAKALIAAAAVGLIASDSSIAIDTGTTALELAALLEPPTRLSIVTPSLPVMAALANRAGIEIIGLGGVLHSESQGFAGPATLAALQSLHVRQTFLSATAIGQGALWCGNPWDAETKRELVRVSDQVVLLADSSKFAAASLANIVPLTAIHVLVTDEGIAQEHLDELRRAGVDVLIARTLAEAGDVQRAGTNR